MNLTWVDFTRRNDPACQQGVDLFSEKVRQCGEPTVLCFWTKAPDTTASLFQPFIRKCTKTLFVAQVTINNYSTEMEPGVPRPTSMERLSSLIGREAIRLRFDPIIVGYTKPAHFRSTIDYAEKYGIKRITINFLVPFYKGVGKLLAAKRFKVENPSDSRKAEIVGKMLEMTPAGIELAICAETSDLLASYPLLKPASCADPEWAVSLRPELSGIFSARPSRKGCGCFYSDDWGEYPSRGGYSCPHQCLYCYAK